MKRLLTGALATALLVAAAPAAQAGTATGATTLLDAATAGSFVRIDVSVLSATPVVAYEYAMVNQCWFGPKASGPADSYQRDPIVDWVYSAPEPYGNVPHAVMTAYLVSVPAGATCKVSLYRNNTFVKGSLTSYQVS
nr:hypothetical protein [Propionibacterium sp.]